MLYLGRPLPPINHQPIFQPEQIDMAGRVDLKALHHEMRRGRNLMPADIHPNAATLTTESLLKPKPIVFALYEEMAAMPSYRTDHRAAHREDEDPPPQGLSERRSISTLSETSKDCEEATRANGGHGRSHGDRRG